MDDVTKTDGVQGVQNRSKRALIVAILAAAGLAALTLVWDRATSRHIAGTTHAAGVLPAGNPLPYDLVGSATDPNGVLLNGRWGSQLTNGVYPSPKLCRNARPWVYPCTSQRTWIDRNTFSCPPGKGLGGILGGHANWRVGTYDGTIFWKSHTPPGFDDDYNIDLHPDRVLYTQANPRAVLLEFDSDETIDHFRTPWWNNFHRAVDRSNAAARRAINGTYAIAIGLVGLDCAHTCSSEIHPVFALAIHVKSSLADDVWAIFVRNWGNEGYCSRGKEVWGATSVTIELPRPGATGVQVTRALFRTHAHGSGPAVSLARGAGALVSFGLPPPSKRDWLNGELHLRWSLGPTSRLSPMFLHLERLAAQGIEADQGAEDERGSPEAHGTRLVRMMTAQQRAIYNRLLPKKPASHDQKPLQGRAGVRVVTAANTVYWMPNPARDRYDSQAFKALVVAYGGKLPR